MESVPAYVLPPQELSPVFIELPIPEYRNMFLEVCMAQHCDPPFESEEQRAFALKIATVVSRLTEHMIPAIRCQLDTYLFQPGFKAKTNSSVNNKAGLIDFYNGVSELQAVCRSFIIQNPVQILQMSAFIKTKKLVRFVSPFPQTSAFLEYVKSKTYNILKRTCISNSSTPHGGYNSFIDLAILGRLLRRRRTGRKKDSALEIKYPDNYNKLAAQCKEKYTSLIKKLEEELWEM